MASSEYLQREEAAKKQLGKKGVAKRAKQLPRAARATARGLLREVTGIDVSRKGVSVSPESLAMALPLGKVLKAAKVLRTAGRAAEASMLEARNVSKLAGREAGKRIAKANNPATSFGVGRKGEQVLSDWIRGAVSVGKETRTASKGVFPRSGGASGTASARMQNVADTITKRHYADVAKKGVGHAEAVDMPRARVLRNLKEKRGIQINKPRAETNSARNKRLNEKYNLPGFDFGPIFKTPKRGK